MNWFHIAAVFFISHLPQPGTFPGLPTALTVWKYQAGDARCPPGRTSSTPWTGGTARACRALRGRTRGWRCPPGGSAGPPPGRSASPGHRSELFLQDRREVGRGRERNQIKITLLRSVGYGYPSHQEPFVSVSFSSNISSLHPRGLRDFWVENFLLHLAVTQQDYGLKTLMAGCSGCQKQQKKLFLITWVLEMNCQVKIIHS